MKQIAKCLVESPQATESSRHRDFRHRHLGFVDELLCEKHSPSLRDRNRRSPKMLQEQPPQLTLAQSQPVSQLLNTVFSAIKRTFRNQRQRARNRIRSPTPRSHVRRRLRAATKARTKPGVLRRRGRTEVICNSQTLAYAQDRSGGNRYPSM